MLLLSDMVMVGDRGMITTARIAALRDVGGMGWLTCLRAPAIAALAADDGPLQLSLFDTQDLATISHPDYPGEQLIACRNPLLAAERTRKRQALTEASQALLTPIAAAVTEGRLHGAAAIGLRIGKLINKHKMAKHFDLDITDTTLTITRRQADIDAEQALDGIYIIRTSLTADQLNPTEVVAAYKALSNVKRDFRILKVDDLDLRPIHHRLEDRVRAHVLICMLAAYLVWHLRVTLASLTFTDQTPPPRDNPVAPVATAAAVGRSSSPGHALVLARNLIARRWMYQPQRPKSDWAEIRRLRPAEGVTISAVARWLGVARNSVKRALASHEPPRCRRAPKGSIVDRPLLHPDTHMVVVTRLTNLRMADDGLK